MAKEIRVEVCESFDVCEGKLDNGQTVVIPAGSLWALPVYEDDGSGDVLYGPASDLRTLAKACPGQFIKRGPTLMTFGTHSRPLACEKCGAVDGAHVRGFAGEDVVRLIRDSIAYKHLQERHSRLHDEKERLRSRDFASDAELVALKTLVASARDQLKKEEQHAKNLQDIANQRAKEIERQKAEILMLREQVEGLKNLKVEVTGSEFVTIRGAISGETELASLRAENDRLQAIVSITPLQSPLGDVVKFHSVKSPKASDFYVTTREPLFAPGALVGDSKVIEICNLVTGEVKEAKVLELEIVYSGKFDYSEVPPSKVMAYLSAFSRPFVAELMAKASRYDKVEAIVAPMVEVSMQDLKGLSNEGSGIGKSII